MEAQAPGCFWFETKDTFEFILDCYERLHKLGIIHKHGLSSYLSSFKAMQWWRAYMECRAFTLPLLTWTQFHALFLEMCVPRTLRDYKKDEFMTLEQGSMYIDTYKAKFHALYRYAT